jgi:hypothetical protein
VPRPGETAGWSVPWSGLRSLVGARTLGAGPPPRPNRPIADLGRGFVLVDLGGELGAFDVFSGALAWRRPRGDAPCAAVVGDAVVLVSVAGPGTLLVERIDARTGASSASLRLERTRAAPPIDPDDLSAFPLDARTLAVLTCERNAGAPRSIRGLGRDAHSLITVEVESGRLVGDAALPESGMLAGRAVSGNVVASAEDRRLVVALDAAGSTLFERDLEATLLGAADGRLLVALPGRPWRLTALDLAGKEAGATLAEHPLAGRPERLLLTAAHLHLVLEAGTSVERFARADLAPAGRLALPGRGELVSTADSLLWLRPEPRQRTTGEVVALDPATGDETARLRVSALAPRPDPVLVAGRLLLAASRDATFVAIEA